MLSQKMIRRLERWEKEVSLLYRQGGRDSRTLKTSGSFLFY